MTRIQTNFIDTICLDTKTVSQQSIAFIYTNRNEFEEIVEQKFISIKKDKIPKNKLKKYIQCI